jgi:ZIP family zinc transporter
MMPSAKESLKKGGMSPKAANWTLIACFIGGAASIQLISRLAHMFMPSHVVECEHSHDEEAAIKEPSEEDGQLRHELAHPPSHDRSHGGSNSTIKQHREHVHIQRPQFSARRSTSARMNRPSGESIFTSGDVNGSATLPLGKNLKRRPSLHARLSQTFSSLASRSKPSCDCDGPCLGFSEPCGADCFKNLQARQTLTRSMIRQQLLRGDTEPSEQTPLLQEITEESSLRPVQDTALRVQKSRSTSSSRNISAEEYTPSLRQADSYASFSSNQQQGGEQNHHHHVPTNVFASIGLQTSIAIALHKLPEGFITFATNHANPNLGFSIFLALFIHNITDGFVLALPLYLAINNRLKAIVWASLLGGASQPLGAGVAAIVFKVAGSQNVAISENFYGSMFAVTAGIMTSVALQLFGESLELTHNRGLCMIFAFVGMAIIGCSAALTA